MRMPNLETERLVVRPFAPADLEAASRVLDLELGYGSSAKTRADAQSARRAWL